MFRKSPVKDLSLLLIGFFLGVSVAYISLLQAEKSEVAKCPAVRQVETLNEVAPQAVTLPAEVKTEENKPGEVETEGTKCPTVETEGTTGSPTVVEAKSSTVKTTETNRNKMRKKLRSKSSRPKYLKDEFHTRQPLYVGVVTAADFLNSRARAVNNTWARYASKVEYFAAAASTETSVGTSLPVISLPGVDDTYPPQKKVYRMLSYMHDNYINDYNWFVRSDDDAYMRIPELISFLSQLDPSEPFYVGSPGFGRGGDLERIRLRPHEHYCMGGPGVVFSRELLIQLAPHLEECLDNVVVSWNEDLEVGRCISRRLGIQCTWAYQMGKLFYTDYTKGVIFKDQSVYKDKTVTSALTMHPFKTPIMMYKIHQFFTEMKLKGLDREKRKYIKELEYIRTVTRQVHAFP